MSSSDLAGEGRRFLILALASGLLMFSGLVAATALVDPYGMLEGRGGSATICAPGIKNRDGMGLMLSLPRVHPPTEIITGSSRVIWGFRQRDMQSPTGSTVLNLGLSSATMPDIDRIVRGAAANATLERVWIGLDFGAVALGESQYPAPGPAVLRAPSRLTAIREGLLSSGPLRVTLALVRQPQSCADPLFDRFGFLNPGAERPHAKPRAVLPDLGERARIVDGWSRRPADRETLYAREMTRLTRLLYDLKSQGVAVVVYTGPTHPAYDSLIDEAGLAGFRMRWQADVERIAREQGAVLVAADRADFLTSLPDLPVGCETAPVDCVFYDATHFRPVVGEAIISEGRRLADENVVPTMHRRASDQ